MTVASYYGCVSDAEVALSGVEHAVQELKKCQNAWILVGDFNLEALEEPLAGALARGVVAWSWDEPFQGAEFCLAPAHQLVVLTLDWAVVGSSLRLCPSDGPFLIMFKWSMRWTWMRRMDIGGHLFGHWRPNLLPSSNGFHAGTRIRLRELWRWNSWMRHGLSCPTRRRTCWLSLACVAIVEHISGDLCLVSMT